MNDFREKKYMLKSLSPNVIPVVTVLFVLCLYMYIYNEYEIYAYNK